MSHEVPEWANDPYVNNVVPFWDQPDGATCFSNLLQVGDPVEAMPKPWYTIKVGSTTFHPSDIAGVSLVRAHQALDRAERPLQGLSDRALDALLTGHCATDWTASSRSNPWR